MPNKNLISVVSAVLNDKFDIDISDEACQVFGFKHGDIVLDPDGKEATIMGVGNPFEGENNLWLAWAEDKGKVAIWCPGHGNLRDAGFRLKNK